MNGKNDYIHLHHVGGRGGDRRFPVLEHFEKDMVNVLYEADSSCVGDIDKELTSLSSKQVVLPRGLGEHTGPSDFYKLWIGSASSILPVSRAFIKDFPFFTEHTIDCDPNSMKPAETMTLELTTLDQVIEGQPSPMASPDFLSLNTQGSELSVLKGAARSINRSTLAVLTEVSVTEIYENQAGFDEITRFLKGYGYRFFNVFPHGRRRHGFTFPDQIVRTPVGLSGGGSVIQMDILYFKEPRLIVKHHEHPRTDLMKALFIGFVYGFFDYSYACSVLLSHAYPDIRDTMNQDISYHQFVRDYLDVSSSYADMFPVCWSHLFKCGEIERFDCESIREKYFKTVSKQAFQKAVSHLMEPEYMGLESLALSYGLKEQAELLRHCRLSTFWDTLRYLGFVHEGNDGSMVLDMAQIENL